MFHMHNVCSLVACMAWYCVNTFTNFCLRFRFLHCLVCLVIPLPNAITLPCFVLFPFIIPFLALCMSFMCVPTMRGAIPYNRLFEALESIYLVLLWT
jgi:hypothetical protein